MLSTTISISGHWQRSSASISDPSAAEGARMVEGS
jgi:hypothetical protein